MDNINKEHESNECSIRGICSVNPAILSMQAVILIYLEELAYYLLELHALGVDNGKIKKNVIDSFSTIVTNVHYSQDDLNQIISMLYEDLYQAREMYKVICERNNKTPFFLKSPIKISKQFNITDAIRQGQKYFTKKAQSASVQEKISFDVLLLVLNSICLYMVELEGLNEDISNAYYELLTVLSKMNFSKSENVDLDELIKKYVYLDHDLMLQTFEARKAIFGEFMTTEIATSIREGKAILVAGANMKDLELLLEATKDQGIDIYTHGQMITAHSFPKFKEYPHLVGHYGKGLEQYLSDFTSFPGAIFMTKLSLHKVESLYRSRIYTTDAIAPKGVITIKNNDFEPLINAALSAEGFKRDIPGKKLHFGVKREDFYASLEKIADRIESGEIKHLFTIGVANKTAAQAEYFEDFIDLLRDDCFMLSFSYTNHNKNIFLANIDYSFPVFYKGLNTLAKGKDVSQLKLNFCYTRCEPHTVPNIFYMKYIGIKNIYFGECSPTLINPALVDTLRDLFELKRYTTPFEDFNAMIGEGE